MNVLQKNLTELLVSPDGSTVFRDNENVYQYSNGTTGVMLYTPYSGENLSALINIRLPDGTVLPENPMTFEGSVKENGEIFYLWSYDFTSLGTSISGYDYSVPLTVSFRFLNAEDNSSKNTNQINIPVQPSLKGAAMVVDPTTADALNAKIDNLYSQVSMLKSGTHFIGTIYNVPEGQEQTYLTNFVRGQTGREPQSGDLVNIEGRKEQWIYGTFGVPPVTEWTFYTSMALVFATSDTPGIAKLYYGIGDGQDGAMTQDSVTTELRRRVLGKFYDSMGTADYTVNYIGSELNETLSPAANYVFINCNGTVTLSSNTTKINVIGSPNLTINGITANNWFNVFIDGVAASPNLGAQVYLTSGAGAEPYPNVEYSQRDAYYRITNKYFIASIVMRFDISKITDEQKSIPLIIGGAYVPQGIISNSGTATVSPFNTDSFGCLMGYGAAISFRTGTNFDPNNLTQSYVRGNTFDKSNGIGTIQCNYVTTI